MIDPFTRQMKREYNTTLDDADYANRNNFVPSQSFTCSMLTGKLFSRSPITKCKLLNVTETSFRRALIQITVTCVKERIVGRNEKQTKEGGWEAG